MSQLLEDEQSMLLQIAREAVRSYLSGTACRIPTVTSAALNEQRALFVSIHQNQELRGCIGNIRPSGPLHQNVAEYAISAAAADPRFMPLTLPELDGVIFEISVLSSMEPVGDVQEIEVGKHGLLINKMQRHGLLLPQVASDHGWDRDRFLSETCRKAGLAPDDWKEGATIQRFTAQIFGERKTHAA